MERTVLVVDEEADGLRVDVFISERSGIASRSQVKTRMTSLLVNDRPGKLAYICRTGDRVEYILAPLPPSEVLAEDIPLRVIYEDSNVVVLDKAAGMVVHPGAGNHGGTVVNGLLAHIEKFDEEEFEDESRPGIVHRLDKETSGVLIAAKNPRSLGILSAQFQDRSAAKVYLAVVKGTPKNRTFFIEGFIRRDPRDRKRFIHDAKTGRAARTDFTLLGSRDGYSVIAAMPKSGRTHQIRVHARELGLPLLGDSTYGKKDPRFPGLRLMLHAWRLSIRVPDESGPRTFEAPIPEDFSDCVREIGLDVGELLAKLRSGQGSARPQES